MSRLNKVVTGAIVATGRQVDTRGQEEVYRIERPEERGVLYDVDPQRALDGAYRGYGTVLAHAERTREGGRQHRL